MTPPTRLPIRARHSASSIFALSLVVFPLSALSLHLACGSSTDPGGQQPPPGQQQPTHPAGTLGNKITINGAGYGVSLSAAGVVGVTLQAENGVSLFPVTATSSTQAPINVDFQPTDIALNRAGTTAYVVSGVNRLYTIDIASRSATSITLGAGTYRLVLSPDESRVFVGGESRVWSVPTAGGAPTSFALTLPGRVVAMAMSPRGNDLFAVSVSDPIDCDVWVLDPATLQMRRGQFDLGITVVDVAVSPDGTLLYALSTDGYLLRNNDSQGQSLGLVAQHPVAMAITPDGAQMYVSTSDGALVVFDLATRKVVKEIQLGGAPRRIAFDKFGTTALVANERGWVDVIH